MSKINWLKNIFRSLIENIFVQIIVSLITLVITLKTIIFYKYKLIEFINYTVTILQVSIFLFVILLIIFIYNYLKSTSVLKFVKYGMKWEVNIKKHSIIKKDNEIAVKGPYCPRCLLEMTESNPFLCLSCNTQYTALNSTNVEEAQRIVKKIIEAELRGGKLLILDWSSSLNQYPKSHFIIKNNGASVASNILIQINLIINNQIKDIGPYNIEKIEPDNVKKIENPDPMLSVHKVLADMKLIKVDDEYIENDKEDEWGMPYVEHHNITWRTLKKKFSCKLEVNMKYSLKNKILNKQNIYSLKFTFLESKTPFGFGMYEDNCVIQMNQIE